MARFNLSRSQSSRSVFRLCDAVSNSIGDYEKEENLATVILLAKTLLVNRFRTEANRKIALDIVLKTFDVEEEILGMNFYFLFDYRT